MKTSLLQEAPSGQRFALWKNKLFVRICSRSHLIWIRSYKAYIYVLLTFTGMQNVINKRSAVAKPPRKTFVGVAGSGLSRQRVDAMMMTFPERNYDSLIVKNQQYFLKRDLPITGYFKKEAKDLGSLINFSD